MALKTFKILPILGLKTNVPQNDPSLFQFLSDGVAATHDVGGVNVDYNRKVNACTKSFGSTVWSNDATSEATRCLGLFELYDGTYRDYIYFDNGKVFRHDDAGDPTEITASPAVLFNRKSSDIYSIIKVGDYVVWSDKGGNTPYKWKHGATNSSKLAASGASYIFRYIENFQRRVIGAYSVGIASDAGTTLETDGNISVRWSTAWPSTAITALNFPTTNQYYVPNDDTIVGIKAMGRDRCFIYCEDSIQLLTATSIYSTPFAIKNVQEKIGATVNSSIISLGDRHFLFNKHYGFCEFRGGQFPHNGRPISWDIEASLQDIRFEYMDRIVGTFIPFTNELCWTGPFGGDFENDTLFFYSLDTGKWRKEDKVHSYVDIWHLTDNRVWADWITGLPNYSTGVWSEAGTNSWDEGIESNFRLTYSMNDGKAYYHYGEAMPSTANLDGYRIEPILDFGDPTRDDLLEEIWFEMGVVGSYSIDVSHRSGNTVGELIAQSWTALDSVSCNSPADAVVRTSKNAKLHQIKWGTNLDSEKFEVNGITFKYKNKGR